MADEKPKTTTRDLVIGGTIAGVTYAATGDPTTASLAGAGSGMLTAIYDLTMAAFREAIDADGRVWWQNVAEHLDGADIREVVFDRIEEPNVHRVIVESLRALADRLDPAVVPALGALTAEYLKSDHAPDWFLRGTARMLAELSADEFAELRTFARELAVARETGLLGVEFRYDHRGGLDGPIEPDEPAVANVSTIRVPRMGSYITTSGDRLPTPVRHYKRVYRVLVAHGLAQDHGETMRIEKAVVLRLHRVLG